MEFNIRTNSKFARNELGEILTQVPEVEEDIAEEMMEIAVKEIRREADRKFNNFSGNMMDELKMENVENAATQGQTVLTLPIDGNTPRDADYLEWHERADTGHYVEVSRDNAPIQKWVKQQYNGSDDPSFLYVTPTPFVKPAVQRIGRKMRRKAESGDNAVKRMIREVK